MIQVTPETGAGEGIRTPDRLITNQELYQLSYASLIPEAHPATTPKGRKQHSALPESAALTMTLP